MPVCSLFLRDGACRLSCRLDCSIEAVGVAGASVARHKVATVGRPKVDFVELLHSSGFNMKEIAAALLISRTTLWRRSK